MNGESSSDNYGNLISILKCRLGVVVRAENEYQSYQTKLKSSYQRPSQEEFPHKGSEGKTAKFISAKERTKSNVTFLNPDCGIHVFC